MPIEVLVPTYDETPTDFQPAPRLQGLEGVTVGFVSNGKHGTIPFFDALAQELQTGYGVAEVIQVTKPNYSAPAGAELLTEAKHWHALVAGIGD